MGLVVQKYGGTSVATLDRIRLVASHIRASVTAGHSLVVVVSAMGQQTDELLAMARSLAPEPPRREVDMLLTAGERISMALLAIALSKLGVQSTSLTGSQSGILTDENHGNARIERISAERIRAALVEGKVVIVAGFQGVSPRTKDITTLGRGGSDLTAIGLAATLTADRCEIYKDVDGICSADPRIVARARVLPIMTWHEVNTLAWSGASVLHARGVHVGAEYGVKLEIRNSLNLGAPGTRISEEVCMEQPVVRALTHRSDLHLVDLVCDRVGDIKFTTLLSELWEHGESPLIFRESSAHSQHAVRILAGESTLTRSMENLKKQVNSTLGCKVSCKEVASIVVVGAGFRQSPELVRQVRSLLGNDVLDFELQNDCIIAVLPRDDIEQRVRTLHGELIA